jgi:hypothetical protein
MDKPADRRRSPRVETRGPVRGRVLSGDIDVEVREISLGGMSIETPARLEVGAVLTFVLRLGDGSETEISGRVVYCRPLDAAAGSRYVSGVQFAGNDESDPQGPGADLMSRAR